MSALMEVFGQQQPSVGRGDGEAAAAIDVLEKRTDPDSWIDPETVYDHTNHTIDVHFKIAWRHAWEPLRLLPRR